MFSTIAVLLTVFSVAHCGGHWDSFMKKYANVKILSDCFGDKFITEWFKNYTEACDFCQNLSPENYLRGVPLNEASFDSLGLQQQFNPLLTSLPGMEHASPFNLYDFQHSGAVPQLSEQGAGLVDVNNFVKRDAEEPLYDHKKISKIYNKFQEQAGNFTCVFKRLKIFNDGFDVDVSHIMSLYSTLNLDIELLTDVTEGVMDCIKFATCKPLNKMTLTPPIVQRAMTFLKCEAKQRVASCVKNDVRKMQHKFDLDALGKVEAGNEADMGDKMMAIMWGDFTK
ncbi:hypothetical protein Avbf_06109 [Armadillidium vulgare]|nr:hypothetical protein Avbf_06109 [Armadillidium vulgare]